MKKLKIFLIVICSVIALTLIGIMGYTISEVKNGKSVGSIFISKSNVELLSEESIDIKNIDDIQVKYKGTPFDILVKRSKDDNIVIKQYVVDEKYLGKIEHDNNKLVIEAPSKINYFSFFTFGNSFGYIEIYLPNAIYKSILVETTSGEVKVDTNLTSDKLRILTTSGDIYLGDVTATNMKLTTTSGDIEANANYNVNQDFIVGTTSGEIYLGDVTATNMKLTTTSGDIEANANYKSNQDFIVGTTSGEIYLGYITATNIELTSTSGDISADKVIGKSKISSTSGEVKLSEVNGECGVSTTSGSIKVQFNKVIGDIELSAISGDVELEIPKDSLFNIDVSTISGDIDTAFDDSLSFDKKGHKAKGTYGEGKATNSVNIKTTSGDVDIELK